MKLGPLVPFVLVGAAKAHRSQVVDWLAIRRFAAAEKAAD